MKDKNKLTLKQKLFCQYYLETFGNGTEAVIKAGYEVKQENGQANKNLAKSIASENLTKPDILTYINFLLEKSGLNDEFVANHHKFLINQFADLSAKAKGIDMYYKVHAKYAATKVENTFDTQIEAALNRISKILPK